MFCLSGIVLNHPSVFSQYNVSRALLPKSYQYNQWDKGLLRGTQTWQNHVLLYGNSGVMITDSTASAFADFNKGLPIGADHRNIRSMVEMPSHKLFALGQYGLYTYHKQGVWQPIEIPNDDHERLSDITKKEDTLVVTGRSYVYWSVPPYNTFEKIQLHTAANDDGKVSLFRTIWLLHSGQLFGFIGRIIVDMVALVLIFLTLTGVLYWIIPRITKRSHAFLMQKLFTWHNSVGKLTMALTLLIGLTGWLLRPPGLIAIASARIKPVAFSTINSNNRWHDNLRSLRYDHVMNDWLLCTTSGFYTLQTLHSIPQPVKHHPEVSVMGINVQQQNNKGQWLIGSFSGLFVWDRKAQSITDYYTKQAAKPSGGMPVGKHVIAGYSSDFAHGPVVAEYGSGTTFAPMPKEFQTLPMSLRSLCVEIHTGRIYTFMGMATMVYICIAGLGFLWCIWTGWKLRK